MANMNAEFGEDKFTYTLQRDPKTSGRLEVTVKATLVHSKDASGKYISADWVGFMEKTKSAME